MGDIVLLDALGLGRGVTQSLGRLSTGGLGRDVTQSTGRLLIEGPGPNSGIVIPS